jgi:hypothetical protein
MKRRTMDDHYARLNALLGDLERSLVIARALRAELTAKTAHINGSASDPAVGTHVPELRLRGPRSRLVKHSPSSVVSLLPS